MVFFRFANSFLNRFGIGTMWRAFRSRWPRTFGVQGRGAFYEEAGAIRDVVENHLFQVLLNLTMEPPIRTDSECVRDEKVQVFRGIQTLKPKNVVRGQFRGYRNEKGVAPNSTVETFAAVNCRSIPGAGKACRFTSAPANVCR